MQKWRREQNRKVCEVEGTRVNEWKEKDNETTFDWIIDQPIRIDMSRFLSYLCIRNK